MYTLYDYLPSGNGYKVRLLLHRLGIPFKHVEKDILKGETRTPEFLAIHPNGRVPVLVTEEGEAIGESNAMLCFLAEDTDLFPKERLARVRILQWLFWEQYSHEPYIATSRFYLSCSGTPEKYTDLVKQKREGGLQALNLMNRHLETRSWMAGDAYSIADIALYAYTHVAHEGGFDLDAYRHIQAWLERVGNAPGHLPITHTFT